MKLESFKDKKVTRRKMILISLGIITIIGVSLLLYKTYTQFNGKVDLDNNDVLFGFYNGNTRLDEMPQKGNDDNLVFEKAECDNGASVEWDNEKWAPLVKGLTKTKTKCTLYFNKKTGVKLLEEKAQEEQTKEEPELMYDDTEDKNLRFVGANPNNYIDIGDRYKGDIYTFHHNNRDIGEYFSIEECENDNQYYIQGNSDTCELSHRKGDSILWRIIGVMKNVTNVETGQQEDLIKIIRADSIGIYSWDTSEDGYGVNEWSQADLMKLLNPNYSDNRDSGCLNNGDNYCSSSYSENQLINNSLYWNNEKGKCYYGQENLYKECDITSNGLSEEAKNKIVKVRWNTGTFTTDDETEWTASATYKAERSENKVCENCYDKVERKTKWDGYIGLMHPSDYGYAVGKSVRTTCLKKSMKNYNVDGCYETDWLGLDNDWTLNPGSHSEDSVFYINRQLMDWWTWALGASDTRDVHPVAYLKSSTTISDALGTPENPFVAS